MDYVTAKSEYTWFFGQVCARYPTCDLGTITELADFTIPSELARICGTCVGCGQNDQRGMDKRLAYADASSNEMLKQKRVLCFDRCFSDRQPFYKPLKCDLCERWTHFGWCKYTPTGMTLLAEKTACFGCCYHQSKTFPVFDASAFDYNDVGKQKAVMHFDTHGFVVIENLLPLELLKEVELTPVLLEECSKKDGFKTVSVDPFKVKQADCNPFVLAAREALAHGYLDSTSLQFIKSVGPTAEAILRGKVFTGVVGKSHLGASSSLKEGLTIFVHPHVDRSQHGPSVFSIQDHIPRKDPDLFDGIRAMHSYPSVQVVGVVGGDGQASSGCLMVLPGSHRTFEEWWTSIEKVPFNQTSVPPATKNAISKKMVPVPMMPGSVCFFDSKLTHANAKGRTGGRQAFHTHVYPASGTPFGLPVLYGLSEHLGPITKHFHVDVQLATSLDLHDMLTGRNTDLPEQAPVSFLRIPNLPHTMAPKQFLKLVEELQEKHAQPPSPANNTAIRAEEMLALSKRSDDLPDQPVFFESPDPLFYIKTGEVHTARKHMERLGGGATNIVLFGYGVTTNKTDIISDSSSSSSSTTNKPAGQKRRRGKGPPELDKVVAYSERYCSKLRTLSSLNVWASGRQPALTAYGPTCYMVQLL